MLTKLRIGAHSLAIETGRYGTTKIPADQRFCKFCPTNVEVEVTGTFSFSVSSMQFIKKWI